MNDNKNLITLAAVFLAIGLVIGFIARGFISGSFDDGWQAAREKISGVSDANKKAVTSLKGSVKETRGDSLILKTVLLSRLDDEELMEREIEIEDTTEVILKRRKTTEELYGREIGGQIIALQTAVEAGNQSRDEILAASDKIQTLKTQARQELNNQVMHLREQLGNLTSEQTAEKEMLDQQIQALLSDYLYESFSFDQVRPGDLVTVTADKDISQAKKFTAKKIEVIRN